ncbi:MAG: PepSY domain-containing protein, partial [Nanoarchaeota archaeon]
DSYRQEYYVGIVEDMGKVVALYETVSVPFGKFTGCVKTFDWTPIEPGVTENKYYCPDVGGVALEVGIEDGERVELISVEYNAQPSPSLTEKPEELKTGVTEEKAKEIALKEVPGIVKDVAIERKLGKMAYVVEIIAESGTETDVIIDINTGEIIGIET